MSIEMAEVEVYRHAFRVLAEGDLEGAARAAIEALVAATRADRGYFVLAPVGDPIAPLVTHRARRTRAPDDGPSRAVVARALAKRAPVRLENALDDPDFRGRPSVLGLSLLSVLAVPIVAGERALAVAYLDSARFAGIFTAATEATASLLARAIAPALARTCEVREAEAKARALAAELDARDQEALLGRSPAFIAALDLARQVAPSDVVVLLRGESGTGKELFARAIHARSRRAAGPLVAINCAALPAGTVEAELFGHVRGAFTGAAHDRPGLVEAAAGGTLFLDEVGDLPLPLQAKLLRVLQDGEVRRLGAASAERVDVRVVAATHRDLAAMVGAGAFRDDLYYRLRGVEVAIPPLRERPDDILLLATAFLRRFAAIEGRRVTGLAVSATEALLAHGYPGNVRELENAIRSAVLLAKGQRLTRRDLPSAFARAASDEAAAPDRPAGARARAPRDAAELKVAKERAVKRLERAFLVRLLERAGGNVSRAAERAGMQRTALHELMARHEVDAGAFRRKRGASAAGDGSGAASG